jgi:Kef-type K+ transport system membrane component KefB
MSTEHIAVQAVGSFAVILVLTSALPPVCRRLGQALVVGQILVGIILGPSVLGRLPGHLSGHLFPAEAVPYLSVVAQIGLVFFLFSVGCQVDLKLLRGYGRLVATVSAGAFLLPLAAGTGLGLAAWYGVIPGTTHTKPEAATVLFVAVALSITAVPVLAAILRESALLATRAGAVALTSAGLMDVAGWIVLAMAIAIAAQGRPTATTLVYCAVYVLAMIIAVRPLLRWLLTLHWETGGSKAAVVLAFALASAWATGFAGLQIIFGALFLGVLMPRTSGGRCDPEVRNAAEQVGLTLLPLFFVVTGLSVNIGALHPSDYAVLALLTVVAVAGKVIGGAVAARWTRLSRHESAVVGILLSTRGLTELIAITAGRTAGLITGRGYTLLVLMAVITTALTGPLLRLSGAPRLISPAAQQASAPAA